MLLLTPFRSELVNFLSHSGDRSKLIFSHIRIKKGDEKQIFKDLQLTNLNTEGTKRSVNSLHDWRVKKSTIAFLAALATCIQTLLQTVLILCRCIKMVNTQKN